MISPLLANIYLHYVLDLWARQWRQRHPRGNVIVVRYADDSVVGFRTQWQAQQFLVPLQEHHAVPGNLIRLGGFRLAVCRLWRQASNGAANVIDFNDHATDALPTSTYLDLEMHILTLRIASRYIPEAGAVCGSSARTDLCGGRQVTAVPTATVC